MGHYVRTLLPREKRVEAELIGDFVGWGPLPARTKIKCRTETAELIWVRVSKDVELPGSFGVSRTVEIEGEQVDDVDGCIEELRGIARDGTEYLRRVVERARTFKTRSDEHENSELRSKLEAEVAAPAPDKSRPQEGLECERRWIAAAREVLKDWRNARP
jgi:hypothetical protein